MGNKLTYKRAVWTTAFLGVTGAAVAMELAAVFTKNDDMQPWSHYLSHHVPKTVTLTGATILSGWLVPHFVNAYKKAGK